MTYVKLYPGKFPSCWKSWIAKATPPAVNSNLVIWLAVVTFEYGITYPILTYLLFMSDGTWHDFCPYVAIKSALMQWNINEPIWTEMFFFLSVSMSLSTLQVDNSINPLNATGANMHWVPLLIRNCGRERVKKHSQLLPLTVATWAAL